MPLEGTVRTHRSLGRITVPHR